MSGRSYSIYRAIEGLEHELRTELSALGIPIFEEWGPLFATEHPVTQVLWAQNTWSEAQIQDITSISQVAKLLKSIQRNWGLTSVAHHRRCQLIQEQLPKIAQKPLEFLSPNPTLPMGAWSLLPDGKLLYSGKTTSPFSDGAMQFAEDHINPPSRAYLKLWEFFTVYRRPPKAGELCMDLGSCPGGWTWVLQGLGCPVISVDKAPLESRIAALPGVTYRQESAFGLNPIGMPKVDWLLSDIICYPARLYNLVDRWLQADKARNFVCTIKFQGETDFDTLEKFKSIPGSELVHLHHNKHEVTWFLIRD